MTNIKEYDDILIFSDIVPIHKRRAIYNFYDVYGKTQNIKNSESQKFDNTVDISDLNSGVYFIKITTNKGESTKLFIKK